MTRNSLQRFSALLALALSAALPPACSEGDSASSSVRLTPVSQIAFPAPLGIGTNGEIYVTSADGAGAVNVTNNLKNDIDPAWRPDGNEIAFSSNRLISNELVPYYRIYRMNPDGSALRPITENSGYDNYAPVWSPDGLRIAFLSNRKPVPNTVPQEFTIDDPHLWVMDADGTNQVEIVWPNSHRLGEDFDPVWSPDSTRIAFQSFRVRDGDNEIYLWNVDATPPTNLSNNPASDAAPAWSPNGSQIAFETDRDGDGDGADDWEIYLMDPDGSNPTNFTNNPGADTRNAAWSPSSAQITYESFASGDAQIEIFVQKSDGSAPGTNLTNNPASDSAPAWSPDGSQIAFQSFRDGVWQIYIMNADGSSSTKISSNPGQNNYEPLWRP